MRADYPASATRFLHFPTKHLVLGTVRNRTQDWMGLAPGPIWLTGWEATSHTSVSLLIALAQEKLVAPGSVTKASRDSHEARQRLERGLGIKPLSSRHETERGA